MTPPQRPGSTPDRHRQRVRHARVVARPRPGTPVAGGSLHFRGQMPGERVIWIRRRHWLFLLGPAWPVLLSGGALALAVRMLGVRPGTALTIDVLALALVVVMLVRWVLVDLGAWVYQYYILTDRRVITSTGFFRPVRREAVLKSVVQVLVRRSNFLLMWLNIGDVSVRVVGSGVDLTSVARPRDVADSILAIQESAGKQVDAESARVAVKSERIQAALDKLAEPVQPPPPPEPGAPPFFGLLQRRLSIQFIEGESVVDVIYRHWFVLVRRLIPPLLLTVVALTAAIVLRSRLLLMNGNLPTVVTSAGVGIGLLWAVLVYLNYVDDVFVLTTHRVIDIDRLLFVLSEYSNDAPYNRVQDVHVQVSALGNIFGFGTIVVETSGRKYPLRMNDVPQALQLMDRIFGLINAVKEREAAQALNRQKRENYTWLATILNQLVVTVPNVRGLSLLEAASKARAAGLKCVVASERIAHDTPSGVVLDQLPSPGTTALQDNEIRVTIAGHGAAVAAS